MSSTTLSVDTGTSAQPPTSPDANRWYALRTRSRHEQILAAELTRVGVSAWAPVVEREQRYGPCGVTVRVPLFPGCVLLHGSAADVARASATGRVLEITALVDPQGAADRAAAVGLPQGHPMRHV